ncbi:DUF3048 domain-containing protein [Ilumatobacter sp.]|uniref:DUF3048 domain-containing protein n=1 Tax=Ilumatobacter sp. TaxID=1967498 RepID=UPI003AF5D721
MDTRPRLALFVIGCLAVTAACSGGSDAAETALSTTTAPPTTPPTTTPPTTAPPTTAATTTSTSSTTTTLPPIPRQPLTGTVLADGDVAIDRPALAVKIDNAPGARRNHSGLAVADIVFEEIVEGSITRFAAVFHSRDSEVVGPIRSGRSQDVDLLTSFVEPLFAWSGGNAGVTRLIAESPLTDLNAVRGGKGYYRGSGQTPHNLYNSTEALWAQTPEGHPGSPPPQQFDYLRPEQEFEGEPVGGVALPMRGISVEWTWDAEEGRFLRSQEGGRHVDQLHGRIGAENVLVFGTWYRPSAIDARSPEAQTVSQGAPLWVFSDGELVEGQWIRTDPHQPFQLVDTEGQPILLTPGTTWVELAEGLFSGEEANPIVEVDVLPAG